jgi:uncharacterized cupin superfamily protein
VDRANISRAEFEYDDNDPQGYRSGLARVGDAAGGKALTVKLYEIPPGQSICPYHYEYEEEWLLVLDGTIALRVPDGEHELAAGEIVCFPPGPLGAHKVTASGEQTAHVLMLSSAHEPAVAVYPDSDKLGVWTGNPEDKVMLRRADGAVDYWAGER